MSHVAIAAALALDGVSTGERLVAFSLSSFANREHRAWPGTRVAAVARDEPEPVPRRPRRSRGAWVVGRSRSRAVGAGTRP